MGLNSKKFFPDKITWFRLPEFIKNLFEAEPDNTAEKLLAFDSEGNPVTVEKSSISGGSGADDQVAAEVPYDNTTSGLTATDTQAAIDELASGSGTDDQIAAEVPVTPIGNLASTNVQSALEELQNDIDVLGQGTGLLPTGQLLVTTQLETSGDPLSLEVLVSDENGDIVETALTDPTTGQATFTLFVGIYSVTIVAPNYEIPVLQNIIDNDPSNNITCFIDQNGEEICVERVGNTLNNVDIGLVQAEVLAIASVDSPPVLNSVLINGGDAQTGNSELTITLDTVGLVDEFRISTSPAFTGASYQPYTSNEIPFVFDFITDTSVTIYVQLRNVVGESSVESDSIDLINAFERSDNSVRYRTLQAAITALETDSIELTEDVTITAVAPVTDTNFGQRFLAEIRDFNQNSDFALTIEGNDNLTVDAGTGGGFLIRNSSNIIFQNIDFVNVASLQEVSFPEQLAGIVALGEIGNEIKSLVVQNCTFNGEFTRPDGSTVNGRYGIVAKNAGNVTINSTNFRNFGVFNMELEVIDAVSINEVNITEADVIVGVISQPCLVEVVGVGYCEIINSNFDAENADTINILTNVERFYARGSKFNNCKGEAFRCANTVELQEFTLESCEVINNLRSPRFSFTRQVSVFDSVTELNVYNCTMELRSPYGSTFFSRIFQVLGSVGTFRNFNNIYEFNFPEFTNNSAEGRMFNSPSLGVLEADYNYYVDNINPDNGNIRNLMYDVQGDDSPLTLRRVQNITDSQLTTNEQNSHLIVNDGSLYTVRFSQLNPAVALPSHGINAAVLPKADVNNQVFDNVRGAYSQTPTDLPVLTDFGFDLLNTFNGDTFDETDNPVVAFSTNLLLFNPEVNVKSRAFKWTLSSTTDTVVLYGSTVAARVLSELDGNGDYTVDNTYDVELTSLI